MATAQATLRRAMMQQVAERRKVLSVLDETFEIFYGEGYAMELLAFTQRAFDNGWGITNVATFNNSGNNVGQLILRNASTTGYVAVDATSLRIYNQSVGVALGPGSGTWATWSDARMKKNVRPLEYGLSALERLEPVRFDYLSDAGSNNSSRLGFVAQNVLPAVPEAVTGTGTDKDMYGLQMTDLIPVCVNAIKELRTQMETMLTQMETVRAFLSSKFPGEFMG
jgi:hypothetical protein